MTEVTKLSVYDLVVLHDFLSKKSNPSDEDKARIASLEGKLCRLIDSIVDDSTFQKLINDGSIRLDN
jgi:membrane protein implicated in regulation of membrane protease activity